MWVHSPVGAPFGFYEDTFGNVTGNIGLSHRMREWLNLVASVSRGFRAPNFNDTVVLQASNFGVDAPSPGLQPEISTNYELGAKMEWDSSDVEAFLYYTRLENLIDRRPGEYLGLPWLDEDEDTIQDPDEPLINQRKNVGEAYITGFELQGWLALSDHLQLRGNVFYTFGSSVTASEPMSRIPPVMGLVGVRWRTNGTSLEAFARAAVAQTRLSQRDMDDSRIDAGGTPGWSDWNLRGSHDFGPVRIDLTFGNVFDHAYKEHGSGVYNPGRHVVVALAFGGGN
jgi:outer membrane receptor protein involved in Fe transport